MMTGELLLKLMMFYYEHETLFQAKALVIDDLLDKYTKLYKKYCGEE